MAPAIPGTRAWKAYFDVALGSQVVDLCGFYFINDLHQAGAVSEVAVVQLHVFRRETYHYMEETHMSSTYRKQSNFKPGSKRK